MIIRIDNKQAVVCSFPGTLTEEQQKDKYLFEVDSLAPNQPRRITCFNPEAHEFYYKDRPIIDPEVIKAHQELTQKRREAEAQKAYCLTWLADNDWKVNKRTLGEWAEDDERWITYLKERKSIRQQYDAAETVLNTKN